MLPPEILNEQAQLSPGEAVKAIMGTPLREARETFEREYLRVQIRRFSGNISRTASFIGMERSALHRKLKALGIGDPKQAKANRRSEPTHAIVSREGAST
jgi:two-component system nitrogen regulation response regulator NtrX